MKKDDGAQREVLLELLRISLIRIRNIATIDRPGWDQKKMLLEWAELAHSLPLLLISGYERNAIEYFLGTGAAMFRRKYPVASDSDFQIACGLLDELSALVGRSADQL
jgi:hypothetical protein